MKVYKLSYSRPGMKLLYYKYITLNAISENEARSILRAKFKNYHINIYGCKVL